MSTPGASAQTDGAGRPSWRVHPLERYDGPDFDEFCIDRGDYLSARRDRTPCLGCPLGDLCQAGFEEQVRRVAAGENPSLIDREFDEESLAPQRLLASLRPAQRTFVTQRIPTLTTGIEVHLDE